MALRSIGVRVAGSVVAACFTAYLAAVAIYAEVEGDANWWPYCWLWVLAAIAVVSAIVWVALALSEPSDKGADFTKTFEAGLASTAEELEAVSLSAAPEAADPTPEPEPGPEPQPEATPAERNPTPPRPRLGDMEARPRPDGVLIVSFIPSGQSVGMLEPRRGGYQATHFQMGDAGWYETAEEGMRGIWEVD